MDCRNAKLDAENFNPRSPHGERQQRRSLLRRTNQYFNPRSPHGERRESPARGAGVHSISIHAPRTGSDAALRVLRVIRRISIHAPRTGSDTFALQNRALFVHFNPRSPHGERRQRRTATRGKGGFQSTLPARGATRNSPPDEGWKRFQSTLPARGATPGGCRRAPPQEISIHAPRTGSDEASVMDSARVTDFNPRSPHGERPPQIH